MIHLYFDPFGEGRADGLGIDGNVLQENYSIQKRGNHLREIIGLNLSFSWRIFWMYSCMVR
jgi:hypothetical protein